MPRAALPSRSAALATPSPAARTWSAIRRFSHSRSKADQINDWINPNAFPAALWRPTRRSGRTPPPPTRDIGSSEPPGSICPGLRARASGMSIRPFPSSSASVRTEYFPFRWEVYNTLNHQNLGLPNTNFCLPPGPGGETDAVHQAGCSFGKITNIQTDPRAMEFSLKFVF